MLRNSQIAQQSSNVHAKMPILWREADSSDWTVADTFFGDHSAAPGSAYGLGEVGPQRGGDTPARQRFNGPWPGAIYGVRAPEPEETALSWAEVHHGVREDLL